MPSPSDEFSLAENPLPCYIFSIPPEILSKIMLMCDRELTIWDETRRSRPAGHNIPVRLTQICSSWRSLALDTRELWSSVTLVLNRRLTGKISAITKCADYWLAKGQRGKLALEIHIGFTVKKGIDLESIGQLLTARASDWRTLTIPNCSDSMAEYVITKMTQSIYLSLEEFKLPAFLTMSDTRFEVLAALPRLRTVSLLTRRYASNYDNFTLPFLPWSQLESVSISPPVSGHECLDVLKNCTELTTLELRVVSDVHDAESRRSVTLSKLSRLRLVAGATSSYGYASSNIESFLDVLHLPILVDLDLRFIGRNSWNPLVSSFWERHAAQLRSLELSNVCFPADVRLLFLTVPNLTSLKLNPYQHEIALTAPDFDALRVEQLLPALTHLDVPVSRVIDSIRSATAFLEARTTATTGVARIAQARFTDLSFSYPKGELHRLHAFETQGMDVRWILGRGDVWASRATSISPSTHSSTRSLSSSEDYSNTPPTTSLVKPKRNPLRRLWQRINNIRLGLV
ncbi:F-box domain-containing protein [Mycena sanguinolenta]|uniref:F-box domain-containing protein n=1 Tax=Mycena sanguinolenta TaxID=230812 RepID=A0A8H6Y7A7_9AGAR|nr:F-box domain-containing protein [Mycena sanguinolenta]